jgi:hypothetical protein
MGPQRRFAWQVSSSMIDALEVPMFRFGVHQRSRPPQKFNSSRSVEKSWPKDELLFETFLSGKCKGGAQHGTLLRTPSINASFVCFIASKRTSLAMHPERSRLLCADLIGLTS